MRTLLGIALALVVGGGLAVPATAQQDPGLVILADGSAGTAGGAGSNTNQDGGTIIFGDIYSDGQTTIITAAEPGPAPAPAPAPAAPSGGGGGGGGGGTAQPTPDDTDADNYPDAAEPAAGLDPSNPDTDGDGVADGDEGNIYGTDPLAYDTDGDGLGDGEELFWTNTSPTNPSDGNAGAAGQTVEAAPASAPAPSSTTRIPAAAPAPAGTAASSGRATSLGPGDADAAPGTVISGVDPAPATSACGAYADWYAAQLAYEAAGGVDAASSVVAAFDPDRDGIACEAMMEV